MKKYLCFLALISSQALAQPSADSGRAILNEKRAAVVTVELVVETQQAFGGESSDDESKTEVTGTIIGPDGLTVVALSAIDPTRMMKGIMPSQFMDEMNMSSQVSDARIILDDDTEIPSEVVLRDEELDLAFVRPRTKPETPLAHVDLSKTAAPSVLDQVFQVGRFGKIANREHSISVDNIVSQVARPRMFYITDAVMGGTSAGIPAFAADGTPVGIYVLRTQQNQGGGRGFGSMMGIMQNMMLILLPGSDILDSAQQAPAWDEAKAE